jgi:2-polyprenyl-3-methyl-5-hydroxy-6-metoxy-1,4-benzoquinol methylase
MSLAELNEIAKRTLYGAGVSGRMVVHTFSIFEKYIQGTSILEVGPAEGIMTPLLASTGKSLTIVEGAELFCKDLGDRFPEADVHHSLIEDYKTDKRFDTIILGHVLEHVHNPVQILGVIKGLLTEGGRILCAVPNSRSLHRQTAVIMGLLDAEDSFSELDVYHGHQRVYSPESFRSDFYRADLDIEVFGGYWLKPISNAQIDDTWTDEMIDASMTLGERYPDIAAEIYIVARVKQG